MSAGLKTMTYDNVYIANTGILYRDFAKKMIEKFYFPIKNLSAFTLSMRARK